MKTTLLYCERCKHLTEHEMIHERVGQCQQCKCVNETPVIEGK